MKDVPAIFVFEDIHDEELSHHYFCFNNRSLGPGFSKSAYWVVSTIYPLWYDINVKLCCGRIDVLNEDRVMYGILDDVTNRLEIETQTIRDGWRMMVSLTSSLNKSIAQGMYRTEERGEWLCPFAFHGNPHFHRLRVPLSRSSALQETCNASFADVRQGELSESESELSESEGELSESEGEVNDANSELNNSNNDNGRENSERQSHLHKESIIRVYHRDDAIDPNEESDMVRSLAACAMEEAKSPQDTVKKEMVKRIKQFLFASDLDTVRPADVHNYILSQFSCYREHRDKYRSFIDESILVCYGQMDEASRILPNLFLGSEYNAADHDCLRAAGIRTIVNVTTEIPAFFEGEFVYHRIL